MLDETGPQIALDSTDKHQILSGFWGLGGPQAPGHCECLMPSAVALALCANLSRPGGD